jgi:LemA protein
MLAWVFFLVGLFLLVALFLYNSLISKRNQVQNAFGGIDAFLKKRHDLIPNLVEAVKGYMRHEQTVLHDLTELRSQARVGTLATPLAVDVENRITSALGQVFAVVEQYPTLKASEPVMKLQAALNDNEEQIAAARRAYNAAVTDYNNAVEQFPSSLVASMMNLQRQTLFQTPDAERASVPVGDLSRTS